MLHARVVTSITLLKVLWNISVLKMVTVQGGGGKGAERATSHSLKGKMVGAGLFKLCRGTGGGGKIAGIRGPGGGKAWG